MKGLLVALAFLTAAAAPVDAATIYKSGTLSNQTPEWWSPNNTYIVNGTLTVPSGGQLFIQAGTTVRVDPGFSIKVQSHHLCQFSAYDRIIQISSKCLTLGTKRIQIDINNRMAR